MFSILNFPILNRVGRLAAVLAVLLLIPAASLASYIPLTLEEMMGMADEVAAVRVKKTETSAYNGKIITTAHLEVAESFKGTQEKDFSITYLGGKIGPAVMLAPGEPQLKPGEEAIMFLNRPLDRAPARMRGKVNLDSPLNKSLKVIGGPQGLFRIVRPEGSEYSRQEGIPAEARIHRPLGTGPRVEAASLRGAATYGDLRTALHNLAGQSISRARAGQSRRVEGIRGAFPIPDRSRDKTIRRFDPLPPAAYMSDEELKTLKQTMEKRERQARELRSKQAPETKDDSQPDTTPAEE